MLPDKDIEKLIDLATKARATGEKAHIDAALLSILAWPGASRSHDLPLVEQIYALYPRKVGKRAALAAISGAIKRGNDPQMMLERVGKFARAKKGQDPQFIPHPSTWFNQDRFLDDEKEWSIHGNGNSGSSKRHVGFTQTRDEEFAHGEERGRDDHFPDVIAF